MEDNYSAKIGIPLLIGNGAAIDAWLYYVRGLTVDQNLLAGILFLALAAASGGTWRFLLKGMNKSRRSLKVGLS